MIRIYYHIYAIEGVESIINEQLKLIKKCINKPYSLTVGVAVSENNNSVDEITKLIYGYNPKIIIGDTKLIGNEFVTLNLIEKDKSSFDDSDYILYLHTKGASKQNTNEYSESERWRNVMQLYNVQHIKNVFEVFNSGLYNTYGVLLETVNDSKNVIYSGNFWWMIGEYAKTIDVTGVYKNRWNAELQYIQMGINWKPYSYFVKDEKDEREKNNINTRFSFNKLI
jgi:hypothetical protein